MTLLKSVDYSEIDFEVYSSQQFATVVFDRDEDDSTALITIIKDRKIIQFEGHNRYNPSARRRSTCIYAKEEWDGGKIIKICTIQHKGETLVEIHSVDQTEFDYLFNH